MLSKIKKYRHGFIIAIYFVAYLILFGYLEQRPVRAYHVVHTVFDDMIPFCEIFIIPYLLWFPYVVITVVYFLFRNKNKKEYFQLIFNHAGKSCNAGMPGQKTGAAGLYQRPEYGTVRTPYVLSTESGGL